VSFLSGSHTRCDEGLLPHEGFKIKITSPIKRIKRKKFLMGFMAMGLKDNIRSCGETLDSIEIVE
jgi:hypothetical protein